MRLLSTAYKMEGLGGASSLVTTRQLSKLYATLVWTAEYAVSAYGIRDQSSRVVVVWTLYFR